MAVSAAAGERLARAAALALIATRALAGCHASAPDRAVPPAPAAPDPLSALRAWENDARGRADFAHASSSTTSLGPDPYALLLVRRGRASRLVGLLRGDSAVVELDDELREVARWPAPESPTGLAASSDGEVYVVGELSSEVARFRFDGTKLAPDGAVELAGVRAMRGVAVGPEGAVHVVEEHGGRLITFWPAEGRAPPRLGAPRERLDTPLCHGPVHVLRVQHSLLVDCLLDHAVVVLPVDDRGFPRAAEQARIVHDGPMWGMDAIPDAEGLLVAVGGVEDHPLDRTQGSFAFVDSFVTLYRVADGQVRKLSEVNASDAGVVTPKALHLSRVRDTTGDFVELDAAAYGSGRALRVRWPERQLPGSLGEPQVEAREAAPGAAAVEALDDGSLAFANPLLDAWVRRGPAGEDVVPVTSTRRGARTADSRVGEALFFTTLMAPWNKSEGRLSRFTCETCHFEGYADGRTHFTGRADVHATTKPLLGLFNNRPYFSRALDPDLATMVDNEFAVAGAKSDHDPWFAVSAAEFPWIERLAPGRDALAPEDLRRSLMAFFMEFAPRPNPAVAGRARWTDFERAGAGAFRDRCEGCHEARLVADDPASRVPFERWEALVMSREGPIVWARADYEKTGVVPYVNEQGARVVSLRRLYKKYPYFTNGSAKSIRNVLDRAGYAAGLFFHDGAPEGGTGLAEDEKASIEAFLALL